MNILITTSTFPRWKNDTELPIVLNLAKNLLKKYNKDIKIFILAPHCHKSKIKDMHDDITIIRFKYFFSKWEKLCYQGGIQSNLKKNKFLYFLIPFFIIFQLLSIKKIIKKEKINIIHANWLIPQGFVAVIYKKIFNKNIKILCTIRGADIFSLKMIFFNLIKKYILKNVDIISVISSSLKKEVLKYHNNQNKIFIIHNGINVDIFKPIKQSLTIINKYNIFSFCILFVGRLVEKKGVIYLINAMPKIISKFPKIKLLIIGSGHDLSFLQNKAKKLKLNSNIIFCGKIPHSKLPTFYNTADIFIGPSIVAQNNDTEGLGNVFIEALACGTSVISTNTGGIPDIIKHNNTGILIKQKNSDAIAEAVINLLNNKEKKQLMSINGKKIVKNKFNWKKISSQYYNLYLILNNL